MIIAMVFQSNKNSLHVSIQMLEQVCFYSVFGYLWLSAGDVGYSDCIPSGSAPKILVPGEHLQQISLPSFPSCCCRWTYRKETQVHKLCLSHVLLCPCPQKEWNGNQGLDMHHEFSLSKALVVASLGTACVVRSWRKVKGWEAEESRQGSRNV